MSIPGYKVDYEREEKLIKQMKRGFARCTLYASPALINSLRERRSKWLAEVTAFICHSPIITVHVLIDDNYWSADSFLIQTGHEAHRTPFKINSQRKCWVKKLFGNQLQAWEWINEITFSSWQE